MFTQPNFFLIGGMRCGSTSLNLMLEQHPEIYMSPVKEPYYYTAEATRNLKDLSPEDRDALKNFVEKGKPRTTETYQSLFQDVGGAKVVGESSHYLYEPKTAVTIFEHCPAARILVCLRNPVDRLFSEYLLFVRDGTEKRHFSDYVKHHAAGYLNGETANKIDVPKLNKGLQAEFLEPWIAQFGRNQVKPVFFDDLKRAPGETMMGIFSWLEVDKSFKVQKIHAQRGGAVKAKWMAGAMNSKRGLLKHIKSLIPKSAKVKLQSAMFSKILERPEIERETQEFLTYFYQDDVEKLADILGKDLSAWCRIR